MYSLPHNCIPLIDSNGEINWTKIKYYKLDIIITNCFVELMVMDKSYMIIHFNNYTG